jgi:hypothetical protein
MHRPLRISIPCVTALLICLFTLSLAVRPLCSVFPSNGHVRHERLGKALFGGPSQERLTVTDAVINRLRNRRDPR